MTICMIGPSYPFRGGIAHYMTLLYRYLKEKHDVKFYAFKRQYPKRLFPGRTDRDASGFAIRGEGVENTLDSVNPLTWWTTFRRIKSDNPDLVVIPWWISFWTPQFWFITSLIRAFTKAKVLFICHNVVQHESKPWDRICTRLVLRNGDHFIVHSSEDLDRLRDMLPDADVRKVFHPIYDVFCFQRYGKAEAQRKLGVSERVILFFGFVRPYKGLRYLLDAMPLILERLDVTLMVAGEFWSDKAEHLERIDRLGIRDKVVIVDEYIPNEEVGLYFCAADVVVLPYVTATQSGIVQIAYGFDKPVIVTEVGGLPDVVEHGKTGFLIDPEDPQAIAEAVILFYEGGYEQILVKGVRDAKGRFSWDRLVEVISSVGEAKRRT
ncbi:glycosyl transferase family 1 [Candidatus Poribacteria bacterium]|nr:MAG: glycosyl transferase family 1 [Candidatus Poribacteria bacterium]